ncbi:hypothetical protein UlMin_025758 [Ulmus minor]
MPFPWKKTKVTRISQIVADLQSPNHGRSLVVETGFPTSLIDLFVKNCDRLKTPLMKKKKNNNNQNNDLRSETTCRCGRICWWFFCFFGFVENFRCGSFGFEQKKLAVGITLSDFLLLCLEYLGKHFLCFFKPCSAVKEALKSMIQNGFESNSIVEEIEILDPNIDIDKEDYSCEKTNVIEKGEILVEKNKSSKKGKTRAKLIKNFVPKRLQSSKKSKKYKGNELSSDVSSYFEDDTLGNLEEQQEQEHEHKKEHPQESRNIGLKWVNVQIFLLYFFYIFKRVF